MRGTAEDFGVLKCYLTKFSVTFMQLALGDYIIVRTMSSENPGRKFIRIFLEIC